MQHRRLQSFIIFQILLLNKYADNIVHSLDYNKMTSLHYVSNIEYKEKPLYTFDLRELSISQKSEENKCKEMAALLL
ncbi:hypothetical protein TVAG_082270 [Trichomonas vaginalis G3]|uniref:Uncharacterized protein n=1 Tax=Trichomonas vaginalis (strain ATCC PRA-98 / G3) TaxID=412133 RepID=A2FM53_TRIV3|nr:hypothetical protein TVAGG3_0685020 [Trichomonas vaginalis G3]EAX94020.1 hypothetical protein TVAG_082270 [Trichomonas vaginalis G3]KAI5508156.1 hypothetical protein TVAGG3_0685020 [Trichomonas vaginalis G3]|eukprot:XP_001306950.1 hypothetical protein [Trichomonas vaginalis G3]